MVVASIRYGIWDPPVNPFVPGKGAFLKGVPQTEIDKDAGEAALREQLRMKAVEEITWEEAETAVLEKGVLVSSAFVVWQGNPSRPRLVLNFKQQSLHWQKGSVRMESLEAFAEDLKPQDRLLSMDVKSGYHHFRLHPRMRDWFLFWYEGRDRTRRYYRCIALPFGWGRSVLWFCRIMKPFTLKIRQMGNRVLPWIDDYLVAANLTGPASKRETAAASEAIQGLMCRLGLTLHPTKQVMGEGSTRIISLGVQIDTDAMTFTLTEEKIRKMKEIAASLMKEGASNRRWVSESRLASACGLAASFILAYPMARFHSRGMQCDLHRVTPAVSQREGKVRLSRSGMTDLKHWRALCRGEGREIQEPAATACMHADASDLGYGGTYGPEMTAGLPGTSDAQGHWTAQDRVDSISVRELRAVRLLMAEHFARELREGGKKRILLWEDNQSVVQAISKMTSRSTAMMSELRKLRTVLQRYGVHIAARWLPSAVNKYADRLSRTWNTQDVQIERRLVASFQEAFDHQGSPIFAHAPLGDHPVAVRKQAWCQLQESWVAGSRLWTPPPELIPLVLGKISREQACGLMLVPTWPNQPWWGRIATSGGRAVCTLPARKDGGPSWRRPNGEGGNDSWTTTVLSFGEVQNTQEDALVQELCRGWGEALVGAGPSQAV
jgi:Reverse transcriptase (RNA-dependent DNA polymerase)